MQRLIDAIPAPGGRVPPDHLRPRGRLPGDRHAGHPRMRWMDLPRSQAHHVRTRSRARRRPHRAGWIVLRFTYRAITARPRQPPTGSPLPSPVGPEPAPHPPHTIRARSVPESGTGRALIVWTAVTYGGGVTTERVPDGPLAGIGPIAYGCWRFAGTDVAAAREKIETALECGMNLIDTADIYGFDGSAPALDPASGFGAAEDLLGRVLAEDARPARSDGARHQGRDRSAGPVRLEPRRTCGRPARRRCAGCGCETLDLYQIHRPDLLAHPEEVAGVLDELVTSGKVRAVGVSNHTVGQTRALQAWLWSPLASSQPEFSLLALDPIADGTLDLCMETGMVPLAWSPLGGGRLGGDIDASRRPCGRCGADLRPHRRRTGRRPIRGTARVGDAPSGRGGADHRHAAAGPHP